MQTLESLLQAFAKRTHARWWIGKRPDVREGQLAKTIAGKVGYPTAQIDPFAIGGMAPLNWQQAAHVLAVAGATSLVYGGCLPPEGRAKDAAMALKDLMGNAKFFGNGFWEIGGPSQWIPLSSATFDCGIIGYDSENAFIFWVEEED